MRSPLCAGSYTLRAIFSSLEPDRAKSVLSRAGSLGTQSLLSSLFTAVRRETVWKVLRTGQPSHHQATHRRVDEGLPGCAQPLVVFGHPPVVADPREGALHHPPTRQHPETPRRHQPLPIYLLALLGPLLSPALSYVLGERLFGLAHHLHAQPQNLLGPSSAPPPVARVDPQVRKARKAIARRVKQQPDAIFVRNFGAVCFGFESTKPSVSTSKRRFLPFTFLAGSKPRSFPPTPVALAD